MTKQENTKQISYRGLIDAAYHAGLVGEFSEECPKEINGLIIPDVLENGSESQTIWRSCWIDGIEDAGSNMALGQQDMERDWQD